MTLSHKRIVASAVGLALAAPMTAFATNGYQLIGIGSYQKSLGGAVTANPGSAMTAVTNPAGMARIGNRADFSVEMFNPNRSTDFSATGGDKVESDAKSYGIPALGWTAPVADDSNWYFGGGAYATSGLGVDYERTLAFPAAASPTGADVYFDGYSSISFFQMAPTLSWQQNDNLAWGAALNINYQSAAFQQRLVSDFDSNGVDDVVQQLDLSKGASAFGYGFSLGVLWDVSDNIALGASYKSRQEFPDLEYNLGQGDISLGGTAFPAGKYKVALDYPQQFAGGVAFGIGQSFKLSADVKYINWKDTLEELKIKGPAGTIALPTNWRDQTIYALGAAWAVTPALNLRAGFNYAEAPIKEEDVGNNLILPAVVTTHYTFGGDYAFNNRWQLGFHVMVVPEEKLTAPLTADPNDPNKGQTIKMDQTSFGLNIGYMF